jgi:hypothetical protein
MMSKKALIFAAWAVFLALEGPVGGEDSAPQPAEFAVIIVIDGCRPEYLELAPLPNIGTLAKAGITYEQAWVGQVPTNTPVSHATLGTGTFPAHHGVVGFKWKHPVTGKSYYPCTLENIRRGLLLKTISEAHVPSVFQLYKSKYPNRRTLAVSSVKRYAALTMGTEAADYILFTPSSKKSKVWGEEGIEKGQVRFFECLAGHAVSDETLDRINRGVRPYDRPGDFDTWVVDAFLTAFEQEQPHFSMLNLPETDETGHLCGGMSSPETMRPVIQNVDHQIGKIIEAFKNAGIYDKTLFVVTADHGMVVNHANVSVWSYCRSFLRPGWLPQLGVTTPFLWLRDSSQSKYAAEAMAGLHPSGIDGIFVKQEGEKGIGYRKTLGLNCDPLFDEAWDYLLGTLACPSSPDIFLRLRENTIIGKKYTLNQRGKHYQGTWGTQHIPLMICGPGVRSDFRSQAPARLVDIPPTVLSLMGISFGRMDGVLLADSLIKADPEHISTQTRVSALLSPYQEALMRKSQADMQERPVSGRGSVLSSPWSYNIFFSGVLLLMCLVTKKWRVIPRRFSYVVLSALVLLFVSFQIAFIYFMFRMLEF